MLPAANGTGWALLQALIGEIVSWAVINQEGNLCIHSGKKDLNGILFPSFNWDIFIFIIYSSISLRLSRHLTKNQCNTIYSPITQALGQSAKKPNKQEFGNSSLNKISVVLG